ncbi:hypothetical protein AB685_25575, partial [Bacillus sp. LL01]|uniref:hypothetical protein n=1 Tax=Bacillus sp. LL01 TaxID=1665556 RepID=UPI00064D3135
MYRIINGAYLSDQETTNTIKELSKLQAYHDLMEVLSKELGTPIKNLKVKKAYQLNAKGERKDEGETFFTTKSLTLTDTNESLVIDFSDVHYESPLLDDVVLISGSIFKNVDDNTKLQKVFTVTEDGIEVTLKNLVAEAVLEGLYLEENLPNDPGFKAGVYNEDAVETAAWYDFCAPGGYQHCGSGCG